MHNNPSGADWREIWAVLQRLVAAAQPERYMPEVLVNEVTGNLIHREQSTKVTRFFSCVK